MNNQMKSKHVLFKSRYITREYTPLGIHSLESAAHSKQFNPRSLTNCILPWKNKSKPDYTNASQEHCGNPSLKTKQVHAHPINTKRKDLSHCLPSKVLCQFRKYEPQMWASFRQTLRLTVNSSQCAVWLSRACLKKDWQLTQSKTRQDKTTCQSIQQENKALSTCLL